jgi:hypothetical protein
VRSQGDCQEETTLPPYASRLTSSFGGEGGHSKSRSLKLLALLQRGPAPS